MDLKKNLEIMQKISRKYRIYNFLIIIVIIIDICIFMRLMIYKQQLLMMTIEKQQKNSKSYIIYRYLYLSLNILVKFNQFFYIFSVQKIQKKEYCSLMQIYIYYSRETEKIHLQNTPVKKVRTK